MSSKPSTKPPEPLLGEDAKTRFAFTILASLDLDMSGADTRGKFKGYTDLSKIVENSDDLIAAINKVYVPPEPKIPKLKIPGVSRLQNLPGVSRVSNLPVVSELVKLPERAVDLLNKPLSYLMQLAKKIFGDSLLNEHLLAETIVKEAANEANEGRRWKVKRIESDDGKAKCLIFKCGDEAQVFFPPTDPFDLGIWKQDFNVRPKALVTSDAVGHQVHKGFLEMTDRIRDKVQEELYNENCKHIKLSGYSLGGAMSVMLAASILDDVKEKVDSIYTYGTPPCGDQGFVDFVERKFPGKILNIINDRDPVPEAMGVFHHVGRLHPGFKRPGQKIILGGHRTGLEHAVHQAPLIGLFATLLPGHLPRTYMQGIAKLLKEQEAAKADGNGDVSGALDGATAEQTGKRKEPGTSPGRVH